MFSAIFDLYIAKLSFNMPQLTSLKLVHQHSSSSWTGWTSVDTGLLLNTASFLQSICQESKKTVTSVGLNLAIHLRRLEISKHASCFFSLAQPLPFQCNPSQLHLEFVALLSSLTFFFFALQSVSAETLSGCSKRLIAVKLSEVTSSILSWNDFHLSVSIYSNIQHSTTQQAKYHDKTLQHK